MSKNKSRAGIALIIVLVLVLLGIGAYVGYTYVQSDVNGNRNTKTEYNLVIEKDDFAYQIGEKLKSNGVIKNDTIWNWWMDKHYPKFLDACKNKNDYDCEFLNDAYMSENVAYQLEGFLFPATYDLAENSKASDVVATMLETFDGKITDKWKSYCDENGMSLYELVTLASVVEKETLGDGVAENIASVFVNRLNIGQQLQSDVTIFYGNKLRKNGFSDEVVASYNTYKCKALPSGPICNPGVDNINAVIEHNDTDYYYFFSDLEKKFHFAKTYSEFETLKQKYPWQ